ncbi:MAG: transposase [Bdellovibrionales bacterium]|nr:transposase [Bdellovibrionales bacterium]
MGIGIDGRVDVLGIWLAETEGAHFWQTVLSDLKSRGVQDILIACVDGLKGFPQAIEAIFPRTQVQLCIVHQIRASLRCMSSKYHKEFMRDLKEVYRAIDHEVAETNLKSLEEKWGAKCPTAVNGWRTNWTNLATYFKA